MRKITILFVLGLTLICTGVQGQQAGWATQVLTGPQGAMIPLLNEQLQRTHFHPAGRTVIHKSVNGSEKWSKVAELTFPESPAEFRKQIGKNLVDRIKSDYELVSDEAVYQFFVNEPIEKIGMYAFLKTYMEAFGLVYIDNGWRQGQEVRYRIEHFEGAERKGQIELSAAATYTQYPDRFELDNRLVTDSLVSVSWQNPASSFAEAIGVDAEVFKRVGQGSYQSIQSSVVIHSAESDSSFIHYQEAIQPGAAYAYYVRLTDWVGNHGLPSDTLYALAYDAGSVSSITELRAQGEGEGVRLSWNPLPSAAIYTGIEVLKSRNYDSAYVVLDTIGPHEVGYLDSRVLSGSMYYYRVRPVFISEADNDFIKYAEVSAVANYPTDHLPPSAPEGVYASVTDQGVRIRWWTPDELDTYGYYVLRGTAPGAMELISGTVQDTAYVDSLIASGYSGQLHYAVMAMNQNQQLSDTSEVVTVAVRQPQVLTPPGGLASRAVPGGVYLHWNHVIEVDDRVTGYAVFRREQGAESFDVLHPGGLLLPDYTDTTGTPGMPYEYAVSTHDVWGNYSVLSPLSRSEGSSVAVGLEAPLAMNLRNLTQGIEVSWPISLTDNSGVYAIYRKEEEHDSFIKIGTTPIDTFYVDASVKPNTTYEYYVVRTSGSREGEPGPTQRITR